MVMVVVMVLIMVLDPSSCRKALDEIVRSCLAEFPFLLKFQYFFFLTSSLFQMKNRGALESFELDGKTSSTHLQPKKNMKKKHGKVVIFNSSTLPVLTPWLWVQGLHH